MTPQKPVVAIDARMLDPVPHGISRYVSAIASGLSTLARERDLPYRPVFLLGEKSPENTVGVFEFVRLSSSFLSLDELTEIPRALRELDARAYHSPSFASLFTYGPFRATCPWAVTVHDLNHLRFGNLKQKIYYQGLLRPFVRKAAEIATVSEFSRSEISRWAKVPESRIEVVYNAIDPSLSRAPDAAESREVLERHGLESGRFFFCLSNPKPHKNVPMLVEAYRAMGETDWPLILSMREHGSALGVRPIGALSESEVRVLRAHAGAVVFPSLYEGFGLPPIEAAVAGTPLIVSDIPPHREGLADLAPAEVLWVDPRDANAWTMALRKAKSGALPRVSAASGAKILARFNELETGRHMDRIYRRMLGRIS